MSEAKDTTPSSVLELRKGDIFTSYQLHPGRFLGGGKLRFITLAQDKVNPAREVALKVTMRNNIFDDKRLMEQFHNEVNVMAQLQHPHIVAFEWAASFPTHHAIVMEFCQYGRLSDLIGRMVRGQMERYFMQTSFGLQHIHEQSIVHRDLKLDNILIDHDNNVKIADFDLSVILEPGQSKVALRKGTLPYMAPEMLKDPLGSYDGFKLDTYALGVVFWCIWFQHDVADLKDYLTIVGRYPWSSALQGYRVVLENLLNPNPELRWTMQQLVSKFSEEPWSQNVVSLTPPASPDPSVSSESEEESSSPSSSSSHLSSDQAPERQH